ncbi:MAG: MAPEG family protein [Marinovum algicola]|uniref:MAPEG family protein n=1 Tax=Roseobacteraceae TaxID=2854170 RepID=UPI0032EFAD52
MTGFAEYGHALAAIVGLALVQLVLGPLSAMRKTKAGLAPGAQPPADYSDSGYRWHRAYGNLVESMPAFVGLVLAAMLAGGSPFWVNLFASGFLLLRILLAVVHINGIGKPDMGLRSFTYVAGWLMCLGLAYLVVKAVFFNG